MKVVVNVMSTVFDFLLKGGPVMIPLGFLSVGTVACALERSFYWSHELRHKRKIAQQMLRAAEVDMNQARRIGEGYLQYAIARFLVAPLQLEQPNPETFRLALEAAADREFVAMRKGDKFLETAIAMSPLLGLLGTVTGLIATFFNLKVGGGGSGFDPAAASAASAGIGEALVSTAGGMIVALTALAVFRICHALQTKHMDYFSDVGSELELCYRQAWFKTMMAGGTEENPTLDSAVVQQLVDVLHALAHGRHPQTNASPLHLGDSAPSH